MPPHARRRRASRLKYTAAAFACLLLVGLCHARAEADTLHINGSSDSQSAIPNAGFVGQTFSHGFNVTAAGQTFDFTFGRFAVAPVGGGGAGGCTDGPCLILTGTLDSPPGPLSFGGAYSQVFITGATELEVDWTSAPLTFAFSTPEGGSGQFTIQLLDLFVVNRSSQTQLFDQLARITVTQFTPGTAAAVPEPAALVLFGAGLAALAARRRNARAQT